MSTEAEKSFTFIAFPKFVITWPVILIGIFLPMLHAMIPSVFTDTVVSGMWIVTVLFVIVALGFDFNGLASMVIGLSVFTLFLIAIVMNSVFHIPVLHQIVEAIIHLSINVSTATMHTFTFAFGLLYFMMIIICLLNNKWVVTQGSMTRRKFPFRGVDEIGIDQIRKVSYEVDDMMEYVLTFGGGSLKVRIGTDDNPDYRHISIVFFVSAADKAIEKFETTATNAHHH